MSCKSLTDVIRQLNEEFDEAEGLYSAEVLQDEDDIEDTSRVNPLSMDESLVLGPPLLESSLVQSYEEVQAISTSESQSGLSEDIVTESSGTVALESSVEDEEERRNVDQFIQNSCGCTTGPKKSPCSRLFGQDILMEYRGNCLQMSSAELDLVIMAQLSAFRTSVQCIPPTYRGSKDNFRPHTSFMFHGIKICQTMFLFLHTMSKQRFVTLCQHMDTHGIVARVHGNTKKTPPNTCSPSQINDVVQFIDNIADSHAMPLPGRLPYHKDSRALLLPTDMLKAKVYQQYLQCCQSKNTTPVGRSKFYQLWKDTRPFVIAMKPADDLCFDCHKLSSTLTRMGHLSEEDKSANLKAYVDHLELAKQERSAYNQQVLLCRNEFQTATDGSDVPMHYSFDFAQQIHYPNNPLQPGPAYFLTARKCQIFGVACETLGWQVNYLIDEAEYAGKRANVTISLLHHFLEEKALRGSVVYLHADNCVGQNKSNAVIQYLAWRILQGKQQSLTLSFMLSGHTKFAPDRHFGLIKKLYRRTRIDTMRCLQDVVCNSSHLGANKAQLIRSSTGEQLVRYYDWVALFQPFFTTIPSITSYHVFRADSNHLGKVFIKKFSSSPEEEINIVRKKIPLTYFPEEISPKGLDAQRQWYLYDHIRQFCSCNLSADLACPMPSVPRQTTNRTSSTSKRPSTSATSSSKKRPHNS